MPDAPPPARSRSAGRANVIASLAAFVIGALLLVGGAATGYAEHCTPPSCSGTENCTTSAECLNGPTPIGFAAEIAGLVAMGVSVLLAAVLARARRRAPSI
ncbi:MAG: hypothetical protein L3J87_04970 [Thermoplasmata archaeon]|nr:hypothetical protein [Thermoplasmata archaeon]MCI4344957.1 hypothetical protein [Thermoplasmata archaeon]